MNAVLLVDLVLVNQQLVVISRNEHRSEFIKEDQHRNARMKINNNEQNPVVQKFSLDSQRILNEEKYFTLSDHVPGNSQYYSSVPTNIKFKQKYELHLLV